MPPTRRHQARRSLGSQESGYHSLLNPIAMRYRGSATNNTTQHSPRAISGAAQCHVKCLVWKFNHEPPFHLQGIGWQPQDPGIPSEHWRVSRLAAKTCRLANSPRKPPTSGRATWKSSQSEIADNGGYLSIQLARRQPLPVPLLLITPLSHTASYMT